VDGGMENPVMMRQTAVDCEEATTGCIGEGTRVNYKGDEILKYASEKNQTQEA